MMSVKVSTLIVLVAFGLAFVSVVHAAGNAIQPKKLFFLGKFGTNFYTYDDTKRNWASSKAFCESMGLEISPVTEKSLLEIPVLRNGLGIWTAGQQNKNITGMVWDGLTDAMDQPAEVAPFNVIKNIQRNPDWCIQLHLFNDEPTNDGMYMQKCTEIRGVLCRTK